MSRTQNATATAPEHLASIQTANRASDTLRGLEKRTQRLKGTCKQCTQPMALIESGFWIHEGLGFAVHSAVVEAQRKAGDRGPH